MAPRPRRTVTDWTGEGFVAVAGGPDGDRLLGVHSVAGLAHPLQHLGDLAHRTPPG